MSNFYTHVLVCYTKVTIGRKKKKNHGYNGSYPYIDTAYDAFPTRPNLPLAYVITGNSAHRENPIQTSPDTASLEINPTSSVRHEMVYTPTRHTTSADETVPLALTTSTTAAF